MNCKFYNDSLEYILIKNTYSNQELLDIWTDLNEMFPEFKGADFTMSAKNDQGGYKKQNKGLFLEYNNNYKNSKILNLRNNLIHKNLNCKIQGIMFKYFPSFNPNKKVPYSSKTLISYYDHGDYYESHRDSSLFTMITFICKDNNKFSGGELCFPDYKTEIKPINNTTIIFPSIISHEVKEVVLKENAPKCGRYSITTFIDMAQVSSNPVIENIKVGDKVDLSLLESMFS